MVLAAFIAKELAALILIRSQSEHQSRMLVPGANVMKLNHTCASLIYKQLLVDHAKIQRSLIQPVGH